MKLDSLRLTKRRAGPLVSPHDVQFVPVTQIGTRSVPCSLQVTGSAGASGS